MKIESRGLRWRACNTAKCTKDSGSASRIQAVCVGNTELVFWRITSLGPCRDSDNTLNSSGVCLGLYYKPDFQSSPLIRSVSTFIYTPVLVDLTVVPYLSIKRNAILTLAAATTEGNTEIYYEIDSILLPVCTAATPVGARIAVEVLMEFDFLTSFLIKRDICCVIDLGAITYLNFSYHMLLR